ncbi:hypothetical protein COW36_04580 [bacterium (Candidatus Blackallbacteria) CG17_big_fil_post_rev_8_21_14_2_50_48_46]|uniref:Uncharacterized protein n=1 Tax=bacterium (Candidatus Blackallbacteria) CG17_big_fil_post_rev_8_21_14_2_50_48_46 TaxID=2014261 RepID=A0A2M7G900_9BACT|nr:MAG: hypothetical protein COW64_04365 [bacterium (Candidatus Blackallbacteria) CG18_big_fil_WC_8_21_14_2_50_49_26]PIW18573.1 MAG: hypothetical protein COW36_04580 [bacterium (Candidatus Blackallbacteria) CG17_big_fil_post_rev_8_21_14_2_50_48_46]PIW46442.1 MAG: hypothetical protein COW20_16100 [bacterium (Candidatus Blackallbacteria) CG13_big_fil_rev_8_21_14_2_50_49_14]
MSPPHLFLALSCLQGRPMQAAAEELLQLSPAGLQLTPGNAPTTNFADWLDIQGLPILKHHGFCWQALRQPVWNGQGRCRVSSDSVHPPQTHDPCATIWWQSVEANPDVQPILESMYPGYLLGTGQELELAMDLGLKLAVDISHLHLQLCQGVLKDQTLKRLQAYEAISEIHLSENNGRHDSHRPLQRQSFGLDWALERGQEIPLVLEAYFHSLSTAEREAQLHLIRGEN